MTLGTFICKRVTYLCPFLTMCTGPHCCQGKHFTFFTHIKDKDIEEEVA